MQQIYSRLGLERRQVDIADPTWERHWFSFARSGEQETGRHQLMGGPGRLGGDRTDRAVQQNVVILQCATAVIDAAAQRFAVAVLIGDDIADYCIVSDGIEATAVNAAAITRTLAMG